MAPKTYLEFATSIINALESQGVIYAIGGSFASIAYGEVRTTLDIDISIVLPMKAVSEFVNAIRQLDYYIDPQTILDAMVHGLPFNILDANDGYKADLFLVQPTPLEESILARRQRVVYDPTNNASAQLYSPEDVIIYKLKYFLMGQSQKHLRDIGAMIVVQGKELDTEYIEHWSQEIGATDVWHQLLAEYQRDQ